MFEPITKFIEEIEQADSFGEWTTPSGEKGTPDNPQFSAYVEYTELVKTFEIEFYRFRRELPYKINNYYEILEKHNMPQQWSGESLSNLDLSKFDQQGILALILGVLRTDRFSEGTMLEFFDSGCILKWLKRLREMEE